MDGDKIVIGAIIAITLGIFGFIAFTSFKKPVDGNIKPEDLIGTAPHYEGKKPQEAKLTLVEFSDFECPYCADIFPTVDSLTSRYSDISVVYRHFPLNIHKYSQIAARASEAASKQGKFWEYARQLFDNQPNFTDDDLYKYAQNIGLNLEQFKSDIASDDIIKVVNDDLAFANKIGLNGTPTFYLVYDGKVELLGSTTPQALETKLNAILGDPTQAVTPTPADQSNTLPTNSPDDSANIQLKVTAINALSKKYPEANLNPSNIVNIEKTEWADSSLGCPEVGKSYSQAIVPGYKVTMKQGDKSIQYNSDEKFENIVTCTK